MTFQKPALLPFSSKEAPKPGVPLRMSLSPSLQNIEIVTK